MSTLTEIAEPGYSPLAQRRLAGGNRKFPHCLDFCRADVIAYRAEVAEHMSISGVQDKISLKLQRGKLYPTDRDGAYILKPIPAADLPRFKDDVPANEHLTMQIASQLFGINTAENACIFFSDGEPAYITRRFDRRDGAKLRQEDFCQLSSRSEETYGRNYKYDGSYEEVGAILRKYCHAYRAEIEKLFKVIVFNYVFSNGDAHLKNFSLYESKQGDYILTPAYDLLCTSMHFPQEGRTALDLFVDFETESFRRNGFYQRPDFLHLAELYGLKPQRALRYLDMFAGQAEAVASLVQRSFLSKVARNDYLERYHDRLKTLRC